jgi:hypothetical protein
VPAGDSGGQVDLHGPSGTVISTSSFCPFLNPS